MKKKIIICCLIIVIISIVFFVTRKIAKMGSEENTPSLPINYIEENVENKENEEDLQNQNETISKIIEEQGLKADENIYEVSSEYDGREILTVKPSVKYNVLLAGMLSTEKIELQNLEKYLENAPIHTGIWIEESSRDKFLELIKNIANAEYSIDEDGFLHQKEVWVMNKYDKKISEMLDDKKLHVFSIKSSMYIVDYVDGSIREYPFEEMDPNDGLEYVEAENKDAYIISENKEGKINQEEVLKEILN